MHARDVRCACCVGETAYIYVRVCVKEWANICVCVH